MKKSFFFVLAVLSVAACQKDASVDTVVTNDGAAIKFSAYISRSVTKAQVTDVTTATLDTFRVASYQTGTATSYYGSEQTARLDANNFKTDQTYFWPTSGSLDFFAYRGSVTGGVSNTAGTATIAYTVKSTADEDLVAAKKLGQGSTSAVQLDFDHILTKIDSVTIAPLTTGNGTTANYKYIFTAVKVTTPKNGGTYTFNDGSWVLSGASTDYSFPNQSGNFLGNGSSPLKTGGFADEMILMPQAATFSVTYSVEYSGDGSTWSEIMASTTKSATITLDKGHKYDIVLRLPIDSSSQEILFSVTVNDWTADSADVDLN